MSLDENHSQDQTFEAKEDTEALLAENDAEEEFILGVFADRSPPYVPEA